tara:strand:- start:479 stop:598 length:120 start_codon:yes stop_codon:yes gene_type:complete
VIISAVNVEKKKKGRKAKRNVTPYVSFANQRQNQEAIEE